MAQAGLSESVLKKLFKEALTETLQEQRELLHDVFAEVLEEFLRTLSLNPACA